MRSHAWIYPENKLMQRATKPLKWRKLSLQRRSFQSELTKRCSLIIRAQIVELYIYHEGDIRLLDDTPLHEGQHDRVYFVEGCPTTTLFSHVANTKQYVSRLERGRPWYADRVCERNDHLHDTLITHNPFNLIAMPCLISKWFDFKFERRCVTYSSKNLRTSWINLLWNDLERFWDYKTPTKRFQAA